jgi:hypothetical protein
VWEVARLYWHMRTTRARNSYCTATLTSPSLSAKEIALDQCWAVLTFVRTGRFRFLHYVMRTWSAFQSIYICLGLWEPNRFSKILFFPLNRFSNMVILVYILTIDFPIQFSQPSFHSFWKLLFILFFYSFFKIFFFT